MREVQATGILVLLFALRCVLPLALIFAIGFFTNKLVDRWEAEDVVPKQPAPTAPRSSQPSLTLPCWLVRNCDPATRSHCAAATDASRACWVARSAQEGALPANCSGCPLYQGQPAVA